MVSVTNDLAPLAEAALPPRMRTWATSPVEATVASRGWNPRTLV
jgi:hypothetical protein